jgi:hypothetical protein
MDSWGCMGGYGGRLIEREVDPNRSSGEGVIGLSRSGTGEGISRRR